MQQSVAESTRTSMTGSPTVRHLRQALLWPLRLMPVTGKASHHGPWQLLRDMGDASPWREVVDEYTGNAGDFHERHYNEFVSFLPYVQRFLYGEGRGNAYAANTDPAAAARSLAATGAGIVSMQEIVDGAATDVLDAQYADNARVSSVGLWSQWITSSVMGASPGCATTRTPAMSCRRKMRIGESPSLPRSSSPCLRARPSPYRKRCTYGRKLTNSL